MKAPCFRWLERFLVLAVILGMVGLGLFGSKHLAAVAVTGFILGLFGWFVFRVLRS